MAYIFQRGKSGTWWIKYYVHGKQVYHSLKTNQERVALRLKRQIEGDEARGDLAAPSRTPLPEFLENFCRFLRTIRTRKSYKNDVSYLRIFFGPLCPAMQPGSHVNPRFTPAPNPKPATDTKRHLHVAATHLEDITTGVIEGFLARRMDEDHISPKTANRSREILSRVFNYARKSWGFVAPDRRTPNPASAVERRREPAHTIRFLTLAQITEQLETLQDDSVLHAAAATLIYAGLRREEALWLTAEDVDLEQRLIYVRAKTIKGEFWQPKTKVNRVVPISGDLLAILRAYPRLGSHVWFFPSRLGLRWDPDNFSQDLRQINQAKGLVWGCLDFRHTFGSQLAQKGESLYKIATLMGNSPEICRKHYAALVPETMHDVVEFASSAVKPNGQRDSMEALLQQVLHRLDGNVAEQPKLRLAK